MVIPAPHTSGFVFLAESLFARAIRRQKGNNDAMAVCRCGFAHCRVLIAGGILPSAAGPTDEKVGWGMHRIPLRARADCASPDECTLVQAAEATQRAGNTHFMVLPGHGSSIQRGYAYIKVMTIDPGDRAPSGAVSVEEALHFFRHRQDLPSTAAPSAPSPRPHPSPLLTASPPGGRVATSGG